MPLPEDVSYTHSRRRPLLHHASRLSNALLSEAIHRGKGISSVVLGEVSEALMTTLGFFLSKDERPLVQGFWLLMVNAFW